MKGSLVFFGLTVLLALCFLSVTFSTHESVASFLGRFASDGRVEGYTEAKHFQIGNIARLMSIAVLAAGGMILLYWKRVAILFGEARGRMIADTKSVLGIGRAAWQTFLQDPASHHVAVAVVLVLGLGVRIWHLVLDLPVGHDESYSYWHYASKSIPAIIARYDVYNNHILHSILAHISLGIFGHDVWTFRFPAFLVGCAMLPASYILGRMIFNRTVGLLTMAWLSGSALLILYSANARGHELVALFFVFQLIAAWLLAESKFKNLFLWIAFTFLAVLSHVTVPTGLFPTGMAYLWVLWKGSREGNVLRHGVKVLASAFLAFVMTFAVYSPAFAFIGIDAIVRASNTVKNTFSDLPHHFSEMVHLLSGDSSPLLAFASFAGLVLFVAVKGYRGKSGSLLAAGLLWFFGVQLSIMLLPPDRSLLFLIPFCILFASAGYHQILSKTRWYESRENAFPVAVAFAIFVSILVRGPYFEIHFPEGPEAYRDFSALVSPDDQLVASGRIKAPVAMYGLIDGVKRETFRDDLAGDGPLLVFVHKEFDEGLAELFSYLSLPFSENWRVERILDRDRYYVSRVFRK